MTLFNNHFSVTTWAIQHQKGKTILDFNKATDDGWQWKSMCKSFAFHSKQINMLAPHN